MNYCPICSSMAFLKVLARKSIVEIISLSVFRRPSVALVALWKLRKKLRMWASVFYSLVVK